MLSRAPSLLVTLDTHRRDPDTFRYWLAARLSRRPSSMNCNCPGRSLTDEELTLGRPARGHKHGTRPVRARTRATYAPERPSAHRTHARVARAPRAAGDAPPTRRVQKSTNRSAGAPMGTRKGRSAPRRRRPRRRRRPPRRPSSPRSAPRGTRRRPPRRPKRRRRRRRPAPTPRRRRRRRRRKIPTPGRRRRSWRFSRDFAGTRRARGTSPTRASDGR